MKQYAAVLIFFFILTGFSFYMIGYQRCKKKSVLNEEGEWTIHTKNESKNVTT